MRGRSAGAKMTGASASLKVVSGKSSRGTAETKNAAPIRKNTKIARNRIPAYSKFPSKYSRRQALSMALAGSVVTFNFST
jgi:hypothetical protein